MIRRLLSLAIFLPLAALATSFALVNRGVVAVNLWPFGLLADLPLYVLVLGSLALGLIVGGGLLALPAWAWRQRMRARERTVARLEAELAAARTQARALPDQAAA